MADGTPQPKFNIPYCKVKGFIGLGVDFLRFPCQVPDRAKCKICDCIPERIYTLLCPHHGLCSDCKEFFIGFYCRECDIHTTPEQLGALRSDYNLDGLRLKVLCPMCDKKLLLGELEEHNRSECPKIVKKCSDCGVKVLNENLQSHQEVECQKRVVLCGSCKSAMSRDKLGVHDQVCPEKPVVCDDCKGEVLRKDESKHASECPMRVVCCENCEGSYAYSSEKEHRKQCEIKKLACEYCKLYLKGDDEKKAHLKICEEASIECAFKDFGCKEKFPRKEMQEHEKDPHNALLNQVILKAMDTISELQQKIKDMERCNMSLQEEAKNEKAKLVKKIQELENRQMSKQKEARNENAKLVKRIQELENRQLEADQYRIDLEDDVKVHRTVLQNLEDKVGRISREAVTRRRVDTLNE